MKLFIGLLFILTLTGCIGEDYDVGVPTAHLYIETVDIQLTEANISWDTESEDVHETIKDVQEFGLSQDEIKVSANQEVTLDFKENEKNGGDIWTDPEITAVLLNDEDQIEIKMNDLREFRFPSDKGNYVLKVEFKSLAGSAQYVGNILIQ
ncbi:MULTISPECIES: hypothetical protein [Bacillaceae]|uniref:Uncharacterized protein n=1 Tax=Domibacillus aminovorans TaxID=29332 RepID=A0A177KUT6_9BACI|nr:MULTISPECIES: hypothetical protein [Bacillaceae]OAH57110.1 hypothetical protein AWH48_19485 [Domibacillus aminovorans]